SATVEEIGIAAAQKIETQVERRHAQPGKHRAPDQAIAATINHRHRSRGVVGRRKRGMAPQPALSFVIEFGEYRSADDVSAGRIGSPYYLLQPVRRRDFIIV